MYLECFLDSIRVLCTIDVLLVVYLYNSIGHGGSIYLKCIYRIIFTPWKDLVLFIFLWQAKDFFYFFEFLL